MVLPWTHWNVQRCATYSRRAEIYFSKPCKTTNRLTIQEESRKEKRYIQKDGVEGNRGLVI
jgi:hypothetical protein